MLTRIRSLAHALLGRKRLEADMQDELGFHIQAYTDDLIRSGVDPSEARRRARMEFGSIERSKQECRESRGLNWPDEFLRNVRYALRTLRKSPGFATAAILTLALGIGANTAIFSVVDASLLRPLPYPAPERLVQIATHFQSQRGSGFQTSQDGRTWEMLRDYSKLLDVAAMSGGWTGVNLAAQGKAQYVDQHRVSSGYFAVLGVPPAMGREFTRDEDRAGGPAATILSHNLWMRLSNGDSGMVGRTILLRGEPHTVVGVMPPDFHSIVHADLWTPLRPSPSGEGAGTNYTLIAAIHRGISLPQANAEVASLGQRLLEGKRIPKGTIVRFGVVPLQEGLADEIRKPLYMLWAAVGIVLLIGCLNIAGLMLVRAAGRTREIATRVALGGGQGAVVRQLLTESLVVALLGGMAGIALGYLGIRVLSVLVEDALGVWQDLRLDWRVLAMTGSVSVLTSLLFGLLPALKALSLDVRAGLSEAGGRGVAGSNSRWPRRLLVFGELAMGMVLLVGAGLMIRTFLHLRDLSPGFDGNNVLIASLSLQDARYSTTEQVNRLFTDTLERIKIIPGVESAAVALGVPYERWLNDNFQRIEDAGTDAGRTITGLNYITPEYFRALRIPLLRGRAFTDRDTTNSAPVAIVNQSFATQYLKGQSAVGTRLMTGKTAREIVGVVGNLQQRPGWDSSAPLTQQPAMFIPATQVPGPAFQMLHTWFAPKWVVRATRPRPSLAAGMREAVQQVDPLLPFKSFQSLNDIRDRTLTSQRLQAVLLGSLAGLALLLAAVGVYGLIANSVAQRTREFGIRMALGASLGRVIWTIVLPGLGLAAGGVLAGSLLALWSIRALRSAVYGIRDVDLNTFAAVAGILLFIAAAASLLPALKMTRLNPANTLRDE